MNVATVRLFFVSANGTMYAKPSCGERLKSKAFANNADETMVVGSQACNCGCVDVADTMDEMNFCASFSEPIIPLIHVLILSCARYPEIVVGFTLGALPLVFCKEFLTAIFISSC